MTPHFTMRRMVQFAETDLAGVLHFANYYRYMEEVEHAFWRSLGLSVVTQWEDKRISWPRVATNCEYFAPAHFEDELELALSLAHVGDRSITFEIEFRREDKPIAVGRATAVCCAMRDGRFEPIAVPEGIRAKLSATAGPSRTQD